MQWLENPKQFKNLSITNINTLSRICEMLTRMVSEPKLIAKNIENNLLKEIYKIIHTKKDKVTFLSCHDHNIVGIASALNIKLPKTINTLNFVSPPASKLILNIWNNNLISSQLIYPTLSTIIKKEEKFITQNVIFQNNKKIIKLKELKI